jgi:hypothetical protein
MNRRMQATFILFVFSFLAIGQGTSRVDVEVPEESNSPYLVPLRRESVPVRRHGKIASFKTSYSGVISVGSPPQEFRVVFDTGSGHVVLPALECQSETCLLHRRYNMATSKSAVLVNSDGTQVEAGDYADQATIGFGTGEITGEFVRDKVCLGPASVQGIDANGTQQAPCLQVALVMAIEMSAQPFKSFAFDGILGLGLSSLALHSRFSFFDVMTKSGSGGGSPHFAVYLTEAEDGEESEVAIGGYNGKRLLEPLAWSPVAKTDLGYWQVHILAVRINGQTLDVCKDGTCHGVVDTGSSHLGVPAPHDREFAEILTQEAVDILDCRLIDAPTIEIELPGANVTIYPETYMRRLPLREGVNVGSAKGVSMDPVNATPAQTEQVESDKMSVMSVNVTTGPAEVGKNSGNFLTPNSSRSAASDEDAVDLPQQVKRHCRPKMMPVSIPAPLGPKLFILGEPVLHRYYTVYDWSAPRIGFGLAASQRNLDGPLALRPGVDRRGSLPDGVDTILMQQRLHVDMDSVSTLDTDGSADSQGWSDADSDDMMLSQVRIDIVVAVYPRQRFGAGV